LHLPDRLRSQAHGPRSRGDDERSLIRYFRNPVLGERSNGAARCFSGQVVAFVGAGPQLALTFVFFLWPAGQAVLQSVRRGDAFGVSTHFAGLENFVAVLSDPLHLGSVEVTAVFSLAVAFLALALGLLFAAMADRIVRGVTFYTTVLLLPYGVAPAIAGVLWLFLFNPSIGIIAAALRRAGFDWNYLLDGNQALLLVILAAACKQVSYNFLFFIAGLQAIPKTLVEAAAIDSAGPHRRFWRVVFPLSASTSFFSWSSTSSTPSSTPSGSSTM
jgi:sn-glycerol 3-phosphate transport system permease protein